MADLVSICNMALGLLSQERITDLDDESNVTAGYCRTFLPIARDSVLEDGKWAFATKRVILQLHETTPPFDWGYQYILPADFIAVQQVNDSDEVEYAVEMSDGQRVLLCDLDTEVYLKYTYRNLLSGHWSPLFAEALACKLAMYLNNAVGSGAATKLKVVAELYDVALRKAKNSQGRQGYKSSEKTSSWTLSRRTTTEET